MKQQQLLKILAGASIVIFTGLAVGCAEKDLYDPDYGKKPLPDESEYFDFSTRGEVNLYVDYNAPGFKTLIEVYGENPLASAMSQREKKEGVEALFKIYTDENGKFEGKMNIPTAVKTVYLYTETWGLPGCVKLEVKDGMVRYDGTQKTTSITRASTRAIEFKGDIPYLIDSNRKLYSICKWGPMGDLHYLNYSAYQNGGPRINQENYETIIYEIGTEDLFSFISRLKRSLLFKDNGQGEVDNSKYVKGPETTNVYTKAKAKLSVTYLNKDASYDNTFGYYYYKGKNHGNIDVNQIKKFIVFPRVSSDSGIDGPVIYPCQSVKLKFFGEDGSGTAQDEFPEGYTVGWFIYSDGYQDYSVFDNGYIAPVGTPISYQKGGGYVSLITSNDTKRSYINVKDEKSGKLILGVEDGINKSYIDLLFYVDANPGSAIEDPNRPSIDDSEKPEDKPDAVETVKGTLAFEDVWPSGGDYDMNDVIVEYERNIYFNKNNMVTKIIDTFKPVWNGAMYTNAFAYQIAKGQVGKVTLPDGAVQENETSSIVVFADNKAAKGNTYVVTREFAPSAAFSKKELQTYNPYIIVNYVPGDHMRREVHLPKTGRTIWADPSLNGSKDDAYFVDRSGAYPFAIDVPVWNFIPVTETIHIDDADQYPEFARWADSHGKANEDWYMHYGK